MKLEKTEPELEDQRSVLPATSYTKIHCQYEYIESLANHTLVWTD